MLSLINIQALKVRTGPWSGARLLIPLISLIAMGSGTVALADDLYLGGPYNTFNFYANNVDTSFGGGSLQNSTLNGKSLAFVYCVDLFDQINVSGDYNQTTVNTTGYANGSRVNNGGEIAWLLDTYAVGAEHNTNAQIALQAAIWHVLYGNGYYLDPTSSAESLYTSYLAALGTKTDPTSNYDWFTPATSSGGGPLQGLVGQVAPVPEPMSILLLGTMLLGLGRMIKHKRSQ